MPMIGWRCGRRGGRGRRSSEIIFVEIDLDVLSTGRTGSIFYEIVCAFAITDR